MVPADRITAEPESKTYAKPRYLDARLDWCMHWATDCGQAVAVKFCRRHRYEVAAAFESEVVGSETGTRLMGNNEVCNAFWCTAFSYITCSRPFSEDRVLKNPGWGRGTPEGGKDGRRLDACWKPTFGCSGKLAADAFCRTKGFSGSLDFTVDLRPGYAPTRYIETGETCDQGCTGFQQIICK